VWEGGVLGNGGVVNFIGVDLAWGPNGGTGLCIATNARVVESAYARTDDEILHRLRAVTEGPCLVAIDAPLIISNPTGRRACERAISRCFSRHHAGAHSSNLSMRAFADGSRGARLCESLGLDMNPAIGRNRETRTAIEVYPHPALVALFDLPVTLKYKAKRGRSIEQRRTAFRHLAALLESLTDATPALDVQTCDGQRSGGRSTRQRPVRNSTAWKMRSTPMCAPTWPCTTGSMG
jgi:predicted RNase H-like nuclease